MKDNISYEGGMTPRLKLCAIFPNNKSIKVLQSWKILQMILEVFDTFIKARELSIGDLV